MNILDYLLLAAVAAGLRTAFRALRRGYLVGRARSGSACAVAGGGGYAVVCKNFAAVLFSSPYGV